MNKFEHRGNSAFLVELPEVASRPNPDTVANVCRWNMTLPGQHPLWSRYAMLACSLAEFPGVPPAKKQFPEATHEITIFAIDPDFPQDAFDRGGVGILEPVNHVKQLVTTDDGCRAVCETLAEEFVNGHLLAEPSGISGARELFSEKCDDVAEFEDEISALWQINQSLKTPESEYQRGFLEGRALEVTKGLDEHPEWWDRTCMCGSCRDY